MAITSKVKCINCGLEIIESLEIPAPEVQQQMDEHLTANTDHEFQFTIILLT